MAAPGPLGVVLAGGAGRRLGGAKATVMLGGRALAVWVADALAAVTGEVAVVAKPDTPLPALGPGVVVWREPDEPAHPLAGVAWALERAGARPVLVCPVDVPFVSAASLRALRDAPGQVAVADGQPLLGRFPESVLPALWAAVRDARPARATVAALQPTVVDVPPSQLCNVNTPDDLAAAEARLAGGAKGP